MVRSGLVGHPVENHLETSLVGGIEERLEIFHGTELGIDRLVVGNGIIGTEGALAALNADLVHRHKPEHVHAEFLQAGKLGLHSLERSLGRELTDIHFVKHGVICPLRMRGGGTAAGARKEQSRGKDEDKLFHVRV